MPIYEYDCPLHGVEEQVRPYSDSDLREVPCTICGRAAERIVSVPAMQPDETWANGCYSISLGKHFNSKKEMREYEKVKGFERGGGPSDREASQAKRKREEMLERKHTRVRNKVIGETVRDIVV